MKRTRKSQKSSNETSTNYVFTNAEKMKNNFFANAANRRKAGDKASGDAGYWTGGRCNWGGSHNLDEDCGELAKFFNSIADVENEINNKVKLSANEQLFNANKQALISKLRELTNKYQVSDAWSIASVCCIWNDYFGSFLKPFLSNFTKKLDRYLKQVEELTPEHQKELLKLEAESREAESAYKENLQKADAETDPNKKAEYVVLANKAAKKAQELKARIKKNPLVQLASFNFLDDLRALSQGNVPANVSPDRQPNGGGSSGSGGGGGQIPNPLQDPQSFFEQNKTMIFLVLGCLALFYLYSQNTQQRRNYYY